MQSDIVSVVDSDSSIAPYADSFMLYSFKDSGSLAVDLTTWETLQVCGLLAYFGNFAIHLECYHAGLQNSFFQLPTPFVKRNNTSARENSNVVSQAVSDLLRLDF